MGLLAIRTKSQCLFRLNNQKLASVLPNRGMSLIKGSKRDGTTVSKGDFRAPVKFTQSAAYLDYKSTENFCGVERPDLPNSHNLVVAGSFIFGFAYLFFLRDDVENDGGMNLIKPIHESAPRLAIPILQATIAENKRQGLNTKKLEQKLAEYLKEPEKHGRIKPKLVEN